jgi:hypothetical protein
MMGPRGDCLAMMIEHLPEPELEFANGNRHVDIRFGLMDFGPLDRDSVRAPGDMKIGIVGTPETIEGVTRWLERCRGGIDAKPSRQPNLFPRFPGFSRETSFGVDLLLDAQFHGVVAPRSVRGIVATAEKAGAVDEAVGLFVQECHYLAENIQPDVIVCAPPADLLDALEQEAEPGEFDEAMADEEDEDEQPRRKRRAFHDVLKARGMAVPVPLQLVRPGTYDPSRRRRQRGRPEREQGLQDEATRAWNFHTALYYKAGGTPWRIAREADEYTACYVGISFYRTHDETQVMTSMAQVFNARGDGVIVRGGPARVERDDRQPHLSETDAHGLLQTALTTYRHEHRNLPARVVVHKSSVYSKGELTGFRAASDEERVASVDLISLNQSSTRLFRIGYYPPLRGTLVALDGASHLLYLKGSVDFFAGWPGMYVPRPIGFRLWNVEQTGRFLGQEILAMSKLNWNDTQFDGGLPITLRAARQVGDILKHVGEHEPIQARYSFYM